MNWFSKILFLGIIGLLPVFGYAQKTDTVWFYNGDRAVCEIKLLQQGKLNIKTVAMGTISVEWRKVAAFSSNKYYEIVLADHSRVYGRFDGVDSLRNVSIVFGIFSETVPIMDIVRLKPLNDNFWKELDGNLNVGFSYTKGTQNLQTSASGEARYRTNRTGNQLYFSNNVSVNPTNESQKQDGGYKFQLFYRKQFYNAIDLRWERNTELGIDTRLIVVLSAGYGLVENSSNVLSLEIGASANREFSTEQVETNNAEMMIRTNYDLFIFAKPKIFIKIKLEAYPSLTVAQRVRTNLDSSLRWEIFRDFTIGIAYWGNSDNRPVNTTGLTFDWGTNITLGYNF